MRSWFCLAPEIDTKEFDMQKQQPPVAVSAQKSTLFSNRVVLSGRLALIKLEAEELETRISKMDNSIPGRSVMEERLLTCKNVISQIDTNLQVIAAASSFLSGSEQLPVDDVMTILYMPERRLCEFSKLLQEAVIKPKVVLPMPPKTDGDSTAAGAAGGGGGGGATD
jgi:hypothetical protein